MASWSGRMVWSISLINLSSDLVNSGGLRLRFVFVPWRISVDLVTLFNSVTMIIAVSAKWSVFLGKMSIHMRISRGINSLGRVITKHKSQIIGWINSSKNRIMVLCLSSCEIKEKTLLMGGSGSERSNWLLIWAKESLRPMRKDITYSIWKYEVKSLTPPQEHLPQVQTGLKLFNSSQIAFNFVK